MITGYNPDVLSCLANLSNDEVFTPPEVANAMLDMLPQELFSNPTTTFLDPACKSGVFLREIAKRLLDGQLPGWKERVDAIDSKKSFGEPLSPEDEDFQTQLQATIDHIFHKQLFAISITELTSLLSRRSVYCSKYPNSIYSVTKFDDPQGNIRFKRIKHKWDGGKCVFCGASQKEYDRSGDLETHAYEFIHTTKPEKVFNMKFDVIIGNPPYQMSTGGGQAQALPLYHKFVNGAKKLAPRYLVMITPSRYFAGGIGLNEFREEMLNDKRVRRVVDYMQSDACFPGVVIAGGVNYFLWDRDHPGECEYTVIDQGKASTAIRDLGEFDVFIRSNIGLNIVKKVLSRREQSVSSIMSALSPFALNSYERGNTHKNPGNLVLYSSNGKSYIAREKITKGIEYIDRFKVAISYATSGSAASADKDGQRKVLAKLAILKPGEVCTFTYFLAGSFSNLEQARNCANYLSTKFARYLLFLSLSSIHVSKEKFRFVPIQDFSRPWTDSDLYEKYNLEQTEIDLIESMIKPMELTGGDGDE